MPRLLAVLLGFDTVTQSTAQEPAAFGCGRAGTAAISGQVEGKFGGVGKQVDVKGKYQFDLAPRRIVWFGLLVKERGRSARWRRARRSWNDCRSKSSRWPGPNSCRPPRPALSRPRSADALLLYLSLGRTAIGSLATTAAGTCTPRTGNRPSCGWSTAVSASHSATSPRCRPRGRKIPARWRRSRPTSARHWDKNFTDFVEAGQSEGPPGYRVCHVIVRGAVGDVPVHWHYYLVSDRQGHQAALAFTLEAEQAREAPGRRPDPRRRPAVQPAAARHKPAPAAK